METPRRSVRRPVDEPLEDALARLRSRWGSASIRLGNGSEAGSSGAVAVAPRATAVARIPGPSLIPGPSGLTDRHRRSELTAAATQAAPLTHGALALVPEPEPIPDPRHDPLAPLSDDIVSTGFPALDAVLGPGGLPRTASAAIRGNLSSGKTTLALRCVAEAQARGAIVAWLDLPRVFDPLDAIARGIDLQWLLVIRPSDPAEGFTLAGALLSGRAVDVLVIDLPSELSDRQGSTLRRLSAHARRVGARLLVLEPATLPVGLHSALGEVTGLRLELERQAWIRLGRDVVGQETRVTVAKNRFGPPGRHVALEIHYAESGERRMAAHRFAGIPGSPGP
jgi:RecA/RadA recombinase